ncbi:type VI secretion system lipoprotein TssJ [Janthinobacterium sp. SUN137]|uniref:type VI secretion system lipoprotein TssJ n=1 Tax=Janthinobacterium sp. SUN137 TaxID=3014789 RepID=UPI002712571D|nr:type VI secretion system lipoprotein TssJ [Janthinobacterium sp. SUN137]MDO8037718.1 type VI secretion system lipoprotein TssJ [Janthinobacterium sp. SUN137]
MPFDAPLRRLARTAALLLLALPLAGCAGGAIGTLANAALQMAGAAKPPPELPDAQKPPRNVNIRLHAAQRLNTDADGRPLALVARIYKLRQSAAFEQAPYDSFLDTQREKTALGADLMEVKEVLLVPGQRYEVQEKVSKEAYFIGVVALFRAPAAQRWRATFAAADAERGGITVGLHACALSVAGIDGGMAPLSTLRCR